MAILDISPNRECTPSFGSLGQPSTTIPKARRRTTEAIFTSKPRDPQLGFTNWAESFEVGHFISILALKLDWSILRGFQPKPRREDAKTNLCEILKVGRTL